MIPGFITPLPVTRIAPQVMMGHCRFSVINPAAEHPALPDALQQAHPKRQSEYLAGRWCAKAALGALLPTLAEAPLPSGADGAPGWPDGVVGSISHSQGQAVALVASKEGYQGVGVDLEPPLSSARAGKLEEKLLCPSESRQLDAMGLSPAQRALWVTRLFSAKESLFKALFPLTGERFYFQDAAAEDLTHTPQQLTLQRTLSRDWQKGQSLNYQWETDKGAMLTLILVTRANPRLP